MSRMVALDQGWEFASSAAGAIEGPEVLDDAGLDWKPAQVPGTVASNLGASLDHPPEIEGLDWWFRCSVRPPAGGRLCFEGLATLAEIWWDGSLIGRSQNMFRPVRVDLPGPTEGELLLCFRAIPIRRRARPRWKTALVERQDLRFVRTSLLGRIPSWMPRLPVVGPWRVARWEFPNGVEIVDLLPGVRDGVAHLQLRVVAAAEIRGARLRIGPHDLTVPVEAGEAAGDLALPALALWWPHSMGEPHLHRGTLRVETEQGEIDLDLGALGFRSIALDQTDGAVRFVVNGRPHFCRGACWTAQEPRGIDGAPCAITASLRQAQAAGLDMLRLGGTMAYGSTELYEAADALGILIWQDLMLANMDYPFEDADFMAELEAEVEHWLVALRPHACIAAWCGGSEIAQQAAMLGLPAEQQGGAFFEQTLPARVAALHPGLPCFPSTPWGGPLPFHTREGLCHYYGVGAYKRPIEDVRRAGVRFSPECMGFSNVPHAESLREAGIPPLPHHPAWKAGVPRDPSAGWDFEDVRDHYLSAAFGVDAVALRSTDPARYLELSRAITAELMLRVFAEWRRPGSGCGGGLVWFWKDLRPGAGWGIVDSAGRPKSVYWALQRAWAPRAVLMTDEGLNGVDLHVHNEVGDALEGELELLLLRGRQRTAQARIPISVAAWEARTFSAEALIGHFEDPTWAYRFGPARHEVVLARLWVAGAVVHEDALFPTGMGLEMQEEVGLKAEAVAVEGGVEVVLEAEVFVQQLSVHCPGWRVDRDHFHLGPGAVRRLRFTAEPGERPFKAWFTAINWRGSRTVRVG